MRISDYFGTNCLCSLSIKRGAGRDVKSREMMLKMNYSATAVASNYHQQPSYADNKLPCGGCRLDTFKPLKVYTAAANFPSNREISHRHTHTAFCLQQEPVRYQQLHRD
jgi:hypothetical protein